jgi:hypothetical protein
MKRPILHAGLIVGALAFGQTGCHQTDKKDTADYTPKKPDDPTAWTDKDIAKGTSTDPGSGSALSPSSGLKGTWSSEGQSIEKDLGVTN